MKKTRFELNKLVNSKGKRFYGMHFYPGVAQYDEPNKTSRVYLNEDTIRKMDPTFEGCPIFVEHVDGVDSDVDEVRKEADGWVLKSFYNAADGKHWAEFIVCSERGFEAIRRGYRLSNAYFHKGMSEGGVWNGVSYDAQITDGAYEHLAIVQMPRYDESVIMTPDEFKSYNLSLESELSRITNSKENKGETMKLNIFKRQKVENDKLDLDGMMVELPKSKKEVSLIKCIEEYDKIVNMSGYASDDHMVKVNDKEEMSVKDLVKAHQAKCNEVEDMKKAKNGEDEDDIENSDDMDDPAMENDSEAEIEMSGEKDVGDRGGDMSMNEDDEEEGKKDKKKNSVAAKILAKKKADRLRNANVREQDMHQVKINLPADAVARGKTRYGV